MTGVREFLIAFLKLTEETIVPPAHCHHAIVFAQYGSDSTGWVDQLALQINDGGKFFAYFIEPKDFGLGVGSLVAEIARRHAERSALAQQGVTIGQFVAGT